MPLSITKYNSDEAKSRRRQRARARYRALSSGGGSGRSLQEALDYYGGLWFAFQDLSNGAVASFTSHEGLGQVLTQGTGTAQPTKSATGISYDGGDVLPRATNTCKFIRRVTVPDSTWGMPSGGTGKGFTCTGMCRIPGTNELWMANHGDQSAAKDGTGPFDPSLIRVSYANGVLTKLQEIRISPLIPGIGSIQDVTFDTSDNTLWFASASAVTGVYHITQAGTLLGDTITASWAPNGLAYVPGEDAIWIGQNATSGDGLEKRSCSTGAVIVASVVTGLASQDMLHYDSATGGLLMSYMGNGSPGQIRCYGTTGTSGARVSTGDIVTDTHADCVEGILWEGTTLLVLSDGFYHSGADPLNQLVEYKIVPPFANEINVCFRAQNVSNSGADSYVEIGNTADGALDGPGFGVYIASATTMTVVFNTANGNTQRALISGVTVPNLTTQFRTISVNINRNTGLLSLYVDGALITTASTSACVGGFPTAFPLRLGGAANAARFYTGSEKDVIMVTGPVNRNAVEAYLNALP